MEKRCLGCGNVFEPVRASGLYCKDSCKKRHLRTLSGTVSGTNKSLAGQDDDLSGPELLSGTSSKELSGTNEDDIGLPAKVVDLVKDLHLNLEKDLGVYGWTADGIFIRPDIRVDQVQNIARLVHAKNGRPCPEFRQQGS